jgi:hypothetical protein
MLATALLFWLRADDQVLDRHGVVVSGTVVDVDRFQRLPQVRVRFVTLTGRTVETNVPGDGDNLHRGDTVAVEYAERDPAYYVRFARQKDGPYSWQLWGVVAALTFAAGATCAAVGGHRLRRASSGRD